MITFQFNLKLKLHAWLKSHLCLSTLHLGTCQSWQGISSREEAQCASVFLSLQHWEIGQGREGETERERTCVYSVCLCVWEGHEMDTLSFFLRSLVLRTGRGEERERTNASLGTYYCRGNTMVAPVSLAKFMVIYEHLDCPGCWR